MGEHSPTPWRLHNRTIVFGSSEDETSVAKIFGSMIDPEIAADATFIVRAVNAHDEMVEALKGLLATPEAVQHLKHLRSGIGTKTASKVWLQAVAALSKATQTTGGE